MRTFILTESQSKEIIQKYQLEKVEEHHSPADAEYGPSPYDSSIFYYGNGKEDEDISLCIEHGAMGSSYELYVNPDYIENVEDQYLEVEFDYSEMECPF